MWIIPLLFCGLGVVFVAASFRKRPPPPPLPPIEPPPLRSSFALLPLVMGLIFILLGVLFGYLGELGEAMKGWK